MENTNNKKYVRWAIFIWAMGIVFLVFAISFAQVRAVAEKVNGINGDTVEIRILLGQVITDLEWIKAEIHKINGQQ